MFLIIVLFFVLALAFVVLKRLMTISDRVANLHGDLKKNQMKLDIELQKLQQQQVQEENSQNDEEKNT